MTQYPKISEHLRSHLQRHEQLAEACNSFLEEHYPSYVCDSGTPLRGLNVASLVTMCVEARISNPTDEELEGIIARWGGPDSSNPASNQLHVIRRYKYSGEVWEI